ncbi:hypothetical protein CEXT_480961 [Caerostris extrusa]|uniref:Uncharacterized protein n=1 Tax=Caerostris extrusa TaxID=172846 RepID=A0AAV4R6B8_CAEEX|nr:hypothetical protein CEXT_480961 [Caerostris extrusa]
MSNLLALTVVFVGFRTDRLLNSLIKQRFDPQSTTTSSFVGTQLFCAAICPPSSGSTWRWIPDQDDKQVLKRNDMKGSNSVTNACPMVYPEEVQIELIGKWVTFRATRYRTTHSLSLPSELAATATSPPPRDSATVFWTPPKGGSEVSLMVNGLAVSLPSLTQPVMRIDVCLSWCMDLARLKSAC